VAEGADDDRARRQSSWLVMVDDECRDAVTDRAASAPHVDDDEHGGLAGAEARLHQRVMRALTLGGGNDLDRRRSPSLERALREDRGREPVESRSLAMTTRPRVAVASNARATPSAAAGVGHRSVRWWRATCMPCERCSDI
jgi:hypothetical protein